MTMEAPVIKAYERYQPGLTVKVEPWAWSDPPTPLLTDKLGGTLPDVVQTFDVATPALVADGVDANLTPYLNSRDFYPKTYWLHNFLSSYVMNAGPGKGKIYAVPQEADATVIYYNQDMFRAAGVPYPKAKWTWSQMLADAKKLEQFRGGKQVVWGLADTPDWQAVYNPLIKALGGRAFGPRSAGLDSPAALKAWSMLVDPTETGQFAPYSLQQSPPGPGAEVLFQSGQVAMYVGVRAQLPAVRLATKGKFNFNVAPMPYVAPGKRPTGAGSVCWGITTQDKNIKASLNFLHWLYSANGGMKILEAGYGVVPAVPSLFGPKAVWRHLPGPPKATGAFVAAATTGLVAPQVPGTVFSVASTDIPKAIEAVVDSHESIKQAFTTLNQQVDAGYSGG